MTGFYYMNRRPYRRPAVNPKPVGSGNDDEETYAQMLERFCKRCSHELVFREDIDNLFCPACAWEPIRKVKEKVEKQEWDNV